MLKKEYSPMRMVSRCGGSLLNDKRQMSKDKKAGALLAVFVLGLWSFDFSL